MDQATDLRALVRQVATAHPPPAAHPRRIVVFGGKGGVGTTTVAVNLAVVLAQEGHRCLLGDAAGGDVALQCRLEPRYTLADALAGSRPLAKVLQTGPAGVQVLAGTRNMVRWHDAAQRAWKGLINDMALLAPRCDVAVIDAGSQPDPLAGLLWQAADRVLLTTTVETAAIMDAYAAIKLLSDAGRLNSIALLVNRPGRSGGARGPRAFGPCLPAVPGLAVGQRRLLGRGQRRGRLHDPRRALGAGHAGIAHQPATTADRTSDGER